MEEIQKHTHTKNIIYIIIGIVLALVIGGGIGYYIGQYNKDQAVATAREEAKKEAESQQKNQQANNNQPAHEKAPAKPTTDPTCNADELTLSTSTTDGGPGAGTTHYAVTLQNSGDRECTLGGYPGVSLVNDNGNQIGQPAERVQNQDEPLVTLNPGDSAQATISMANSTNFSDGQCSDGATKLRVYPPNDTGYLSVMAEITTWCPGFDVSPVVAI